MLDATDACDGSPILGHDETDEDSRTYALDADSPGGLRRLTPSIPAPQSRAPGIADLIRLKKDLWLTNQALEASLHSHRRQVQMQTRVLETEINAERRLARAELDLTRVQVALTRSQQELRQLQAQEQLELATSELERRMRLFEADQVLNTRLTRASLEREEADAERRLRLAVDTATPREARLLLGAALERETLLAKVEHIRAQRRSGTYVPETPVSETTAAPPPEAPCPPEAPPPPAVEVDIETEEINRIALRAFLHFNEAGPEQLGPLWQEWEEGLRRRFSAYICEEIFRQVDELQRMAQP